jgi:hypothetical protein
MRLGWWIWIFPFRTELSLVEAETILESLTILNECNTFSFYNSLYQNRNTCLQIHPGFLEPKQSL